MRRRGTLWARAERCRQPAEEPARPIGTNYNCTGGATFVKDLSLTSRLLYKGSTTSGGWRVVYEAVPGTDLRGGGARVPEGAGEEGGGTWTTFEGFFSRR